MDERKTMITEEKLSIGILGQPPLLHDLDTRRQMIIEDRERIIGGYILVGIILLLLVFTVWGPVW